LIGAGSTISRCFNYARLDWLLLTKGHLNQRRLVGGAHTMSSSPRFAPPRDQYFLCRIGKIIGALFLAARVAEVRAAWAARKPEAIEEVDRRLAAAGLTIDAVMAQTLCEHLDEMRGIEAMIAIAEVRRNGALCEIERHRATLAHSLRQTVQQIDAEYQAVDLKLAERKRPS
jgi:hypothetical protein